MFDCIRPTKNVVLQISFSKYCSVPGYVRLGWVRLCIGQVRLGRDQVQVWLGQIRFEQEGWYINILGQVRFDCIRPTKNVVLQKSFSKYCSVPGQVRLGWVRLGKVRLGIGQVRLGLNRKVSILISQVMLGLVAYATLKM